MKRFLACIICGCAWLVLRGSAQTYTVLHSFTNNPDGRFPEAGLLLNGNTLYGTTANGGTWSNGTMFAVNTGGSNYLVLYDFSPLGPLHTNADGANPQSTLILLSDTLYGTARNGGYVSNGSSITGNGTVFSIVTNGANFTNLLNIPPSEPFPAAGLVSDGSTLYGTTFGMSGGSQFGSVFKVATNGTGYTSLQTFGGSGNASTGWNPESTLVLDGSALYGTTTAGGALSGAGTVFKVNAGGGGFTNLIVFTNAGFPAGRLILSSNVLYGTTGSGGIYGGGSIFRINTDGTGYTILKSFSNNVNAVDGAAPVTGVLLSGSTLYGTAKFGGNSGDGTIFSIGTDGSGFTVLKSFQGSDGNNPVGDLAMGGGTLYGTTQTGGSANEGVVFSLALPPPGLQITNSSNEIIVYWLDDGRNHTLQTSTNIVEGWSDIPALNWTNNSTGTVTIGYQVPDSADIPTSFFRLR